MANLYFCCSMPASIRVTCSTDHIILYINVCAYRMTDLGTGNFSQFELLCYHPDCDGGGFSVRQMTSIRLGVLTEWGADQTDCVFRTGFVDLN